MTTYTFKPKSSTASDNWDDPTIWSTGVVPNSPDADTVFPTITTLSTGQIYLSYVSVMASEAFVVRSIQIQNNALEILGSLTATTSIALQSGSVVYMHGGTFKGGSITNDGIVLGSGSISASSILNDTEIDGDGLTIQAGSLTNKGSLRTDENNFSINVTPGGFTNLAGSTLTGGDYSASSGSVLSLNVGSVISTDAASIELNYGGTIQSFDPLKAQYVSLTSSLQTIAPTGSLTITVSPNSEASQAYAFGALKVAGSVTLGTPPDFGGGRGTSASIGASQLTVAPGGLVTGAGTISGPIDNEGTIRSGFGINPTSSSYGGSSPLVLNGPVSGNGTLEISAGAYFTINPGLVGAYSAVYKSSIELTGAASGAVKFDNGVGTLILDAPATFSGTIAPSAGDVIMLDNTALGAITGKTYNGNAAGGILTLQEGTASQSLTFVGHYTVDSFALFSGPQTLSSDPPSVDIIVGNPVCFATGVLIRTVAGDRAVEDLRIGDLVVNAAGAHRPISWLAHRTVDCRRHPRPHEAQPVRVRAHAFATGRPARDLLLSPGHAICVDLLGEVLIPACALVNGTTVVQEQVDTVTYWHVELEGGHDILLAENLPCESYLEMGNRGFFAEAEATALHAVPDARAITHADFCRPFHQEGPVVAFVRDRLSARAPDLGWTLSLDPLADLHLVVDGRRIDPELQGLSARFLVPAGAKDVWLVSDTSVPAQVGVAADLRQLGVCVGTLVFDEGFETPQMILASDPRLCVGFHHVEEGPQRWTAGRARLPAKLWDSCRSSFFLRVELTRPALPRWMVPAAAIRNEASKLAG